MQSSQPLACAKCGTVLAVSGGRCPNCGTVQPLEPPPGTSLSPMPPGAVPIRPMRDGPPRRKPPNKALPWVVLGVGLAAIGLAGALLSPRRSRSIASAAAPAVAPPEAASARPADPNDLGIPDLATVDPTDLLARAKTRALAWNHEALLVSMRVSGLSGDKVDVRGGGSIEYSFGKPTGEGFGAGARVTGKRLRVAVTSAGTTIEEASTGAGRAALEPNCPIDEAARKARAAGLSTSAALSIGYQFDDKHKKSVFRVTAAGDEGHPRIVDGWTCAILVR